MTAANCSKAPGRPEAFTSPDASAERAASPTIAPISIRGGGVAAHCCEGLLAQAGLASSRVASVPSKAPAILLGAGAVHLLRQCLESPDLLRNARRVSRRIVAWGGAEPNVLPHEALVLSGGELHQALAGISAPQAEPTGRLATPFTIHTEAPFPQSEVLHFGQRSASAVPVLLRHESDAEACWIEAVEDGWLFMIPSGEMTAWLLAVGSALEVLLEESRHIAPRITVQDFAPTRFETAPRMLARLSGHGWLACGTEAIAFDPLCGDGTAQAAREASLASAVLHAISGTDGHEAAVRPFLDHYHSMLLASLRRHLRACGQFYATGHQTPWWREQLAATQRGFDWCSQQLATFPEPRYRLQGITLIPIETSA